MTAFGTLAWLCLLWAWCYPESVGKWAAKITRAYRAALASPAPEGET